MPKLIVQEEFVPGRYPREDWNVEVYAIAISYEWGVEDVQVFAKREDRDRVERAFLVERLADYFDGSDYEFDADAPIQVLRELWVEEGAASSDDDYEITTVKLPVRDLTLI